MKSDTLREMHDTVVITLISLILILVASRVNYKGLASCCREHWRNWLQADNSDTDKLRQWRCDSIMEFNGWAASVLGLMSIHIIVMRASFDLKGWLTTAQDYVFCACLSACC
eukprot:TRINITY_DN73421_c0_g1_i1.p1 TRINITY_DN73421_c0_g1~~TRINITY_DN73421_c0_g1_i1.p1  ORF type:complete len:112 (-),score=10.92 TRINITY_DN73421_c0_g1_i1:106-441(-)